MELEKLTIPMSVWDSAEFVISRAEHVCIDEQKLAALVQPVCARFAEGFDAVEDAFGSTGDLDRDINLVFFETAANFCFWAQGPSERWMFRHGDDVSGGWYGLRNAFAAALADGVPVYDAEYVANLTIPQAAELFRGEDGVQIPLLEQRVNNIVETAELLLRDYDGSAKKFVAACGYDAATIAREVTRQLASYRDGAWYAGRWVWILKRAQILANDLAQLTQKYPEFEIRGKNQLTIFADYRLPQVLEHYGVLQYSDTLQYKIDHEQLIASGSPEEIEIRAATLVACRELGELCPNMSIADIDVSLWLLSQDARDSPDLRPHHRTVSYFY